jgi:hypothetical protein
MASVARTGFRACVIGAAQTLMLGVALAQSPIQPRDPNMPDPKTTIPEKIRPEEPDTTGSTGNLSDKLSRSEGVIKPRADVDPEIEVPAPVPNPGTTPVIPPPDSPGGDERIRPK